MGNYKMSYCSNCITFKNRSGRPIVQFPDNWYISIQRTRMIMHRHPNASPRVVAYSEPVQFTTERLTTAPLQRDYLFSRYTVGPVVCVMELFCSYCGILRFSGIRAENSFVILREKKNGKQLIIGI